MSLFLWLVARSTTKQAGTRCLEEKKGFGLKYAHLSLCDHAWSSTRKKMVRWAQFLKSAILMHSN